MLTPDFAKQEDLERYEAFMAKLVELIVGKYDGSLKAEHGTGINMAPYVEREWGEQATELMWRVKQLADPDGVLAPGVVLNRDPGVHLRNLKTTPPIEESATTCVECGFCEPVCPSRNLTTTPRQRIVLRREIARQPEGSPLRRALLEEYEYDGLDTCAADGSCQLACPVGIDTGKLVKELRAERHGERAEKRALAAARRWDVVEGASRAGAARRRAARAADEARPGAAEGRLLEAAAHPPRRGRRRLRPLLHQPDLRRPPVEALVEVSRRAGLPVWIPEDVAGSCCGLPWSSKGFRDAHRHKANEMVERLWGWSGEGALPIVDRRRLLHAGHRRPPARASSTRRTPSASPRSRSSTRSPGPTTACCPGSRSAAGSARPPSTRPAPPATWASPAACDRSPASSPRRSTSPPPRPAAPSPATAASPTPS